MKKIKKNQIIITVLAIMIAVAGYINYTGNLTNAINAGKEGATDALGNPVDEVSGDILSNDAEPDANSLEEPGSALFTSGTAVSSSVISNAKLSREQVRAKNKELLMEIVNDTSISEESKKDAIAKLSAITDDSEKELAAELLLEAKGFTGAVVSVLDGNVDVVINKTSITDTERAQIEDVVKRKTGVTADKITINICNNQNN